MSSEIEGEESLVAAAKQIMMALRTKKNLTVDTKKILAELCTELMISENEFNKINEIEERLIGIQEKIMNCEADQPLVGESGLNESIEYLTNAVNEAGKLKGSLESLCRNEDKKKELLHRAQDVLQTAMERVEEEFKHRLVKNRFEPEKVSVCSIFAVDVASEIGLGDVLPENSLHKDGGNRNPNEFIIELVPADVVSELRCIANLMFISGFGDRCSQAYISVQKNALEECLLIPEDDKLNTEDVLKLDWESLNSKIKRWIQTMRILVRVYLASVKWLTEQIFGEFRAVNLVSFAEDSMLQLLNFGKAISQGSQKLEKLFPILDIYVALADLLPDIDSLYSDEAGCHVRIDCREFLRRLSDYARGAFLAFVNGIIKSPSSFLIRGGGICQLTVDVMNYLNALTGYRKTLKLLLENHTEDDSMFEYPDLRSTMEEENMSESSCDLSSIASHFRSDASIREWVFNGSPMNPAMEEENMSESSCDFSSIASHSRSDASIREWVFNGSPMNPAMEEETMRRGTYLSEKIRGGKGGLLPTAPHFQSIDSILKWHYCWSQTCPAMEEDNINGGTCDLSIVSLHFQAVASILECILNDKVEEYNGSSFEDMFLLKNIHYMVQKVKNSELRVIFGDEWIQKHIQIFQQHATNYETATRNYRQTIMPSRKPSSEEENGGGFGNECPVAARATTAMVGNEGKDMTRGSAEKLVFFSKVSRVFDIIDLMRASVEVLGRGTFGMTYKADLDVGNVVVVKRLKAVSISLTGFREKIEALGAMYHENLVPLRAYSYTRDEMLLVYDYMEMGSLSALLHRNKEAADRTPLNWETRFGIALGVARGIEYLHSQGPILYHGNIKSSNILLTESYDARVSDYGLDHLVDPRHGAPADLVPSDYRASQKADVHSFGVLLLELMTGKVLLDLSKKVDLEQFRSIVRKEWTSQLVDVKAPAETLELVLLGDQCIAGNRLSMSYVRSRIEKLRRSFLWKYYIYKLK